VIVVDDLVYGQEAVWRSRWNFEECDFVDKGKSALFC